MPSKAIESGAARPRTHLPANYGLRMAGSACHDDGSRTGVDPTHAKQPKDVMVVPMVRLERSSRHGPFAEARTATGFVPAGTPSFGSAPTSGSRSMQVAACSNKPFEFVPGYARRGRVLGDGSC